MKTLPISQDTLIVALVAIVLAVIGGLCWLGANRDSVTRLNTCCMMFVYSPLQMIMEWCRNGQQAIRTWVRDQVHGESPNQVNRHHIMWIFGSLIYTVLTVIFLTCELGVLAQTYESLGLSANLLTETSPGTLMAIATWTAAIAWGLYLFDVLGVTHLAPWMGNFSPIVRGTFIGICILGTITAVTSQFLLGYYRTGIAVHEVIPSAQLAQAEERVPAAEGGDDIDATIARLQESVAATAQSYVPPAWIPLAAFLCANAAIIGAGLVSFNGALPLVKWIILFCITAAGFLPLVITGGISSMLLAMIDRMHAILQTVLDMAIDQGQAILGLAGWQPKERQIETAAPAGSANESAPAEEFEAAASAPGPTPTGKPESDQGDEFNYTVSSKGFDPMGVGA
ncbi:MAG: hypothetical protein F9K32_13480 [Desulfobulbaceae bacterium]|nr:MAG: hypothetical protein F9K32_13480 [Desulfobulbaceae bacterium]